MAHIGTKNLLKHLTRKHSHLAIPHGDYVETWLILLTLRSLATSDRDRQAFFPDQLVQVVGLLL